MLNILDLAGGICPVQLHEGSATPFVWGGVEEAVCRGQTIAAHRLLLTHINVNSSIRIQEKLQQSTRPHTRCEEALRQTQYQAPSQSSSPKAQQTSGFMLGWSLFMFFISLFI